MLHRNKCKIQSLCNGPDLVICDQCLHTKRSWSISLISCGRFPASVSDTLKKKHIITGAKRLWSNSIFLKPAVFAIPGTILSSVRYYDLSTGPITSPTTPIRAVLLKSWFVPLPSANCWVMTSPAATRTPKAKTKSNEELNCLCSPGRSTQLLYLALLGNTTGHGMGLGGWES